MDRSPEGTDPWPEVARKVGEDVAEGRAEEGILFCWTGTGVSIAANKVAGVRAALCVDAETARGARLWNNANVLCLSMRLTSEIRAGGDPRSLVRDPVRTHRDRRSLPDDDRPDG